MIPAFSLNSGSRARSKVVDLVALTPAVLLFFSRMFRADNKGLLDSHSFPILKLPTVVLFQVLEYLNKREKAILSRVNRAFRELLNSPNLWKNTTFVLSPKKLDHCRHIVNLLRPRRAQSIIFVSPCSKDFQREILRGLPSLRSITVDSPNPATLEQIVNYAKNITKLHLGKVSVEKTPGLALHFEKLESLVHVSLDRNVFKFDCDIMEEIRTALCYHGNLKSLQLHSFFSVDFEWLCDIIQKNPSLESLGLFFMRNISMEGQLKRNMFNKGLAAFKENFTLKELNLCGSLRSNYIITQSIAWLDSYPSLVYLNLSFSMDERVLRLALLNLYKTPNLQKLDLTKSALQNDMFRENHPKLRYLELKSCFVITGHAIRTLASVMGNTLRYLGLSNCTRIRDTDLNALTSLFPSLDTIDLSGCTGIGDSVLFQDLFPGNLRKIIMKGCLISESTVQVARQSSWNKISVIL